MSDVTRKLPPQPPLEIRSEGWDGQLELLRKILQEDLVYGAVSRIIRDANGYVTRAGIVAGLPEGVPDELITLALERLLKESMIDRAQPMYRWRTK